MGSKTKIIVLHMKEIIYTGIFIVLGILFIILLLFMFLPGKKNHTSDSPQYIPGIYTSTVSINNTDLEVEVVLDSSHINAIRFTNLDESVTAMYPLIQPAIESIADQIYQTQSLENISFSEESPYTSQIILNAIEEAIEKAEVNQ